MGSLEHFANLAQDTANALRAETLVLFEDHVQRLALDVLHQDAGAVRRVQISVVQGDGVRMLEGRHRLHFVEEELLEAGIAGDVVVHDLDNDLAGQIDLAAQVHPAHAAFANQAHDAIPSEEYFTLHRRHRCRVPVRRVTTSWASVPSVKALSGKCTTFTRNFFRLPRFYLAPTAKRNSFFEALAVKSAPGQRV